MRAIRRFSAALAAVLILVGSVPALAETVSLPVTLDYPLLRALFLQRFFTAPDQMAVVLDADEGCTKMTLAEPEFDREGERVRLTTKVHIRLGLKLPLGGGCVQPVDWEGYLEILMRPYLDESAWGLRFQVEDSRIFNKKRQRGELSRRMWDLIKTHLHDYLNRRQVNLAPPVDEVRDLLPVLFDPQEQPQVKRWLESLRPGQVTVTDQAVRVEMLMDVEKLPQARLAERERKLTEAELDRFVQLWEAWDAFLVHQLGALASKDLTKEEKRLVFETVIDTRQAFVQELTNDNLGRDTVRRQFVTAWRNLAPIFRKYLGAEPSNATINYLAFFTASDALTALDALGPTLGLEISRDGLVRLARLVAEGEQPLVSLAYTYAVSPNLRAIMGLGPAPEEPGLEIEEEEIELEDPAEPAEQPQPSGWLDWLWPKAWAAAKAKAKATPVQAATQVKEWLVTPQNFDKYLPKVRRVLAEEADKVLTKSDLSQDRRSFFKLLVQATSWQESCFRQFKTAKGKVVYLRSYNNTSVGLMQVNERVWRQIYNVNSLRWNVAYNAQAGINILEKYLTDFALPKLDQAKAADHDLVARVCYAMYNGGPGQLSAFLQRHKANSPYRSDLLFWEKYNQAKLEQYQKVSQCLFGQ